MIDVCLDCDPEFVAAAGYVIEFFLGVLGLDYRLCSPGETDSRPDGFFLYYGDLKAARSNREEDTIDVPGRGQIFIQAAPLHDTSAILQQIDWRQQCVPVFAGGQDRWPGVPQLYFSGTEKPAVLFLKQKRQIYLLGDIISSGFYFLSRMEEYTEGGRDAYGRFPGQESLAYRNGFLNFPVVDAYIFLLDQLLGSLFREAQIPYVKRSLWPEHYQCAICLSHDVDWVRKWTVGGSARYLLDLGRPATSPRYHFMKRLLIFSRSRFSGLDPYDNLSEILELEARYAAKSTFFFLPGVKNIHHVDRKITGRYPRGFDIRKNVGEILNRGSELGLHGSFQSFNNAAQLCQEKAMLQAQTGMEPQGVRQHFLRYRFPHTPRVHQEAGLKYDTTLGFGDCPGYRCGTSFPYELFDWHRKNKLNIVEIPMVVMDGGLETKRPGSSQRDSKGLSSEDQKWQEVERMLRWTRQFNGLFTVLWHNTSFCHLDDGGILRGVYERLLRRGRDMQAWFCSCGLLLDWWQWRRQLVIGESVPPERGRFAYQIRIPPGDMKSFGLQVTTVGPRCDVEVSGCRIEQVVQGQPKNRVVNLYFSDWDSDEIKLCLQTEISGEL